MLSTRPPQSIFRFLVGAASLVIVIAGLRAAGDFVSPLLLAGLIGLLCLPIVRLLERRGVRTMIALGIVLLGVLLIAVATVAFTLLSAAQLVDRVPDYFGRLQAWQAQLQAWGINISSLLSADAIDPGQAAALIGRTASSLVGVISIAVLMFFTIMYVLVEADAYWGRLRQELGARNPMLARLGEVNTSIVKFFFIRAWLGAVAAILDVVLLWALGVDLALLWGALSFILSFVPNLGFILALIPPTVLAVLQFGLLRGGLVVLGYVVINVAIDYILSPRYVGQGLGLSSLISFLAVLFWTWVLGPLGGLLAVPLTVLVQKVVLESYPDTRWLARVIGTDDNGPVVADSAPGGDD